jgi:hypothetical protein
LYYYKTCVGLKVIFNERPFKNLKLFKETTARPGLFSIPTPPQIRNSNMNRFELRNMEFIFSLLYKFYCGRKDVTFLLPLLFPILLYLGK